jgi:hypothetical protein
MAFSPTDYRRLSPAELKRLGLGAGSKRRALATIKRVTKATPTLTDRQYAQLRIGKRVGKETTKEAYSNLVKQGRIKYETRQARSAGEGRFVSVYIPKIAPKHLRLINKWYEDGYNGLTDKEKKTFGKLFKMYSRGSLLQALGSGDLGAYAMTG